MTQEQRTLLKHIDANINIGEIGVHFDSILIGLRKIDVTADRIEKAVKVTGSDSTKAIRDKTGKKRQQHQAAENVLKVARIAGDCLDSSEVEKTHISDGKQL